MSERALRSRIGLRALMSGLATSRSVLNEFRTRGQKRIMYILLILSKRAELLQRREYGNCQDIH